MTQRTPTVPSMSWPVGPAGVVTPGNGPTASVNAARAVASDTVPSGWTWPNTPSQAGPGDWPADEGCAPAPAEDFGGPPPHARLMLPARTLSATGASDLLSPAGELIGAPRARPPPPRQVHAQPSWKCRVPTSAT